MFQMSEMNHALFVLVLNSLYNTQQFTFFLSLCPFSPACPLRTAPVHLNPFWLISGLSSSCLGLALPFPHVLYLMLILTTWGCWYFPPFLWVFSTLTQQCCGTSCCGRYIYVIPHEGVSAEYPHTYTNTVWSYVMWKRESDPFVRHMLHMFLCIRSAPSITR